MSTQRQFHAVADIFPLMPEDELQALADDITANGLLVPIIVNDAGDILDGRHRYLACQRAGVEPAYTTNTTKDPVGLVASLNAQRRNINAGQRAVAAAEAWDLVDVRPRGNQGKGAKNCPIDEEAEAGRRATKLAAQFGVNKTYVKQARFLVVNDKPGAAAIKSGGESLPSTYKEAKQRHDAKSSVGARLEQVRYVDASLASLVVEGKLTLAAAQRELEERAEQRRLQCYAAMNNLHQAMMVTMPTEGDPMIRAERLMSDWDADQFPAGPLKPTPEAIERCAQVLIHIAALLRQREEKSK